MAIGDASDPFLVKQNDTRPKIRWQPKQGNPPAVIPMTGATAVFSMRRMTSPNTVVISRAAATIVDAANGILEYTPTAAWSATNDTYQAEFEVTFADGGIMTFPPGDKYIYILVADDIA